ncbi:MAG: TIGR04211 family SH3 domain-containing protein [Proteobacteria bacterium]|jgi:SH3 domain protein|nr:TIGR04211 family SH3 domain-containing protein [Pseudomonadota bacterium]
MRKIRPVVLLIGLIVMGNTALNAETRYVTDRILLGIHAEPTEESPLLDSIPSGTALEVLETNDSFSKVRLPNGKTGWASRSYLMEQKPATAKVDQLQASTQKAEADMKAIQEKLAKTERELQVRGDELSNARTTIKELKKNAPSAEPVVDTKLAEELATANQEITDLRQQLAQQQAAADAASGSESVDENKLASLEKENAALKGRIELARASLAGDQLPTTVDMALNKPGIPGWYWGVLALMLIVGIVAGLMLMDYKHRQRHGGFRV